MQSLRSTSLRRLCLSVTASVARPPPNALLSALSCRTRFFTSSSLRRDPGDSQFSHRITEEARKEKYSEVEEVESTPTKVKTPTTVLFVGNIPWSATQDDLQETFSVYGPIQKVAVGTNAEGRPAGYAHIEFESKEGAIRATEAHEESPITLDGREIRLDYGIPISNKGYPRRGFKDHREPSPAIFVGNVPSNATRDDVREAMKSLGDVAAVRIALGRDGNPKGFAHVDFTNTAEAEKVLKHYQHHPVHVLGQEVRMDRAAAAQTTYPPSPRLYFTGWEGDTSSLNTHFRALRSKIVDLCIFKSPDPNLRTGSGFVEFRDLETAKEALVRFNTPELALAYARPKPHSRPHSATRGGGRRDGRSREGGRPADSSYGLTAKSSNFVR